MKILARELVPGMFIVPDGTLRIAGLVISVQGDFKPEHSFYKDEDFIQIGLITLKGTLYVGELFQTVEFDIM